MKNKYPVITLCGSTRFKDMFLKVQKDLTLKGNIVISVGLFGHDGDDEVWENKSEGAITETKRMLDDMHKSKIDLSDEIYVINPGGYIGESTWSEICYARMTGKKIESLEPIDTSDVILKVAEHIRKAEGLAWSQMDFISKRQPYFDKDTMVYLDVKGEPVFDPWFCGDESLTIGSFYPCHGNRTKGYDPFRLYGKAKMARFIETITAKEIAPESEILYTIERREKLIKDISFFCEHLHMEYPKGYPDSMSEEEMQDFVSCWSEYDPLPDLK